MITKIMNVLTVTLIISLSLSIPAALAERMPRQTVLFHEGTSAEEIENYITSLEKKGFVLMKRIPFINGIVVWVPDTVTPLTPDSDARVAGVENDQVMRLQAITAAGRKNPTSRHIIPSPDQTTTGSIRNQRPHGILKMMGHPYDPFEALSLYDQRYIQRVILDANRLKHLKNIKMAVFDTGVDADHPKLRFRKNKKMLAGGIDLINMTDGIPADDNGHGTHVSGTLAGDTFGMAPGIELYMVKVLDENAAGEVSTLIMALQWCIDKGIDIINMSVAYREDNPTVHMAIRKAHEAGIVMVAAAGNHSNWIEDEVTSGEGGSGEGGSGEGGASGTNSWPVMYPAAYPEVIAVGAIDAFGDVAPFSNLGPEIDIMAPGTGVYSSTLNRGYGIASGTSMACPHIAGAVALMKALDENKALTPDMVKTIVRETANPDGSLNLFDALQEVLHLR